MIQLEEDTQVDVLESRLQRGSELLFDMERRGDTGSEYIQWLEHWMRLLDRYESLNAA